MQNGRIIAVVIIIVCVVLFIMLAVGFALSSSNNNNNNNPSSSTTTLAPAPSTTTTTTPIPAPAPASLAPSPAPAPSPACIPGSCSMDAGKRYVGAASENINGPGAIKTTLSDCQSKCNANPQCKQFVYFQPNQFCYLETQVHSDPPIVDSRFTSGYCHNC